MFSSQTQRQATIPGTCAEVLLTSRRQLRSLKQKSREARPTMSLSQAFQKVRQLKLLSDQKRAEKRVVIDALKESGLYQEVCQCLPEQRVLSTEDIDRLRHRLATTTALHEWSWFVVGNALFHGVVMFSRFKTVAPALLLKSTANGFELQSFHFDFSTQQLMG
ncbi:hypothetical protein L1D61_26900 [Vibrio mediterranei]|jgi:hypothetical protein|uniref:Uncharacterized protein n=1 Tax=Vibrio mediterranei TaxID=689 RepID=A0A3G4VLT9_9VIBR|nr:hypothetical protein [Vibrio mediterranei]AYV24968.1 hypothetical protein ECB94_26980 [Vibrio mediterranei]MCG9790746.1 hypothetical protein [Vibrio mediterranei]